MNENAKCCRSSRLSAARAVSGKDVVVFSFCRHTTVTSCRNKTFAKGFPFRTGTPILTTKELIMKFGMFCAAAVAALGLSAPVTAGDLTINGSTTVLPVVQKAGEAFMASHPSVHLSISGGGSGNGIKALIEKQCDIAMSSRDIQAKEKAAAEKNGVNPQRIAIAVDAIVPVVHPSNKVSDLSVQQLADIYAGKIRNWKEVGGDDAKIVVISRDTSSGTFESWHELIMKKTRVTPAALMQASNGAVSQAIAKNKNAIGYLGLGYLNSAVKGLSVNKVTASADTALSRQWPIARELYIFTNGAPAGDAKLFVDYLLAGDKGQKDVREVGFVPLSR